MTSSRLDRSEAGNEVLSASQRLMDGLLAEEHRCFARMAEHLQELADLVEARVRRLARGSGRPAILVHMQEVLPRPAEVETLLLPPIGDLLAVTRERTLVVARRQLRAVESVQADRWAGTASRAVSRTRVQAGELEEAWFTTAKLGVLDGMASTAAAMVEQARIWWSRGDEPVNLLVDRWCQVDGLRLPGAGSRGALWGVRATCNAEARTASVALTNALLLSAMAGWNEITQAS